MKLTVAELFAGVGGFRVGLNKIKEIDPETGRAVEDGDWDFVYANQWEPSRVSQHAFDCYVKRFGKDNNSNEDINKVDKKSIPDHNLLVGGFPCQDYSVARTKSNEKGIQGKKGVLFWDIRDTLEAKETPFVLLENVDRLLKSPAKQRGRDFAVMLRTLDDLGYTVSWRVINAADYRMPQKRRRVFIFAFKNSTKYAQYIRNIPYMDRLLKKDMLLNKVFPVNLGGKIDEKEINSYQDAVDITENWNQGKFSSSGIMIDGKIYEFEADSKKEGIYSLGRLMEKALDYNPDDTSEYELSDKKLEKFEYLKGSKRIKRKRPNGETYYYSEGKMSFPEDINQPGRTMLTSEGSVNRSTHVVKDLKTGRLRTLTEIEAEMMQMFPVNWTDAMPKTNRYFMMGNALVTGVIERLEPELKAIIENE